MDSGILRAESQRGESPNSNAERVRKPLHACRSIERVTFRKISAALLAEFRHRRAAAEKATRRESVVWGGGGGNCAR